MLHYDKTAKASYEQLWQAIIEKQIQLKLKQQ